MSAPDDLFPDTIGATESTELRTVMQALAVGATPRGRTWLYTLLGAVGARNDAGGRFTSEAVRDRLNQLREQKMVEELPGHAAGWQLERRLGEQVLASVLDGPQREAWFEALLKVEGMDRYPHAQFSRPEAALAVVRMEIFSGKPLAQVAARWERACGWMAGWDRILDEAVYDVASLPMLQRLEPSLQAKLVMARLHEGLMRWTPDPLPLVELAMGMLQADLGTQETPMRLLLAERLLCAGQAAQLEPLVEPMRHAQGTPAADHQRALAQALDAAVIAHQGRWAEAELAYDSALAALKKTSGVRKGFLPVMLLMPYVQCLLAQQTPQQLDKALKLCLAEAGQRRPTPDTPWGLMAMAVQMRKGDAPRDLRAFQVQLFGGSALSPLDFWKWLMRAWLKEQRAAEELDRDEREAADALLARLQSAGLAWMHAQCEDALHLLAERPVRPGFFVPAAQEGWRVALAGLAAIAQPVAAAAPSRSEGAAESRLTWVITLDEDGEVGDIAVQEQKRGARGWSKPQDVSLWKLARMAALPPHDAQVARHVKQQPFGGARDLVLDLAAAIVALVGHPAVEFADAPGVPVTLSEGAPELEVTDLGDTLKLGVRPALRAAPEPASPWVSGSQAQRAAEALAAITVLRDGPQRARVVRFTAAQRRAAQLVGAGLTLPKSAAAELQPVLQGLGAHFQVHADTATAARDVQGDSRLRAELQPAGDGLRLRLVAAPLGAEGPRVPPGHGRSRMIAAVHGETLAAQRDLAAERAHLRKVLDACPVLEGLSIGEAEYEATEAEDALAIVEALASLEEAVGAMDWPAGKALSVTPVDASRLTVQVRSERDWLALAGGVQVDETLVLSLEKLLRWTGTRSGRFVPLGEGRYLALTQELRNRMADLAAVAELQDDAVRLTPLAAGWLDAELEGCDWQADRKLRERIDRLVQARSLQPGLPNTLQASLRSYQADGFQWAMRLAAAGCGACLADDMGLGKTLQALAVLLARAAGGPALVAAPTSLIGNWQSEIRRFAPSLRSLVYADESDRQAMIDAAGPHDVVLVSYALLQLNAEALASREWHTAVFDEAQALKNAAAKRTQAAQAVKADFRLALSGTPIENRLAELWSVMRLCNPGLLGSLTRFNERFAAPIERDRDRDAQRRLRRLIAPFILRRTKAEVLDDLPPRTEMVLTVQPDAAERAHYELLRRQAVQDAERSLAEGGGQAHMNVLAQLTRLRRAACDPRLVNPSLGMAGAKVQAFAELAEHLAANGHKALVFSQFVDFLSLLRQPLDEAGIAYQYLDGSTPAAERTRRVAAFQAGEGSLFLISLKAGGFGLNLTVADYVVIADPWWNPAAEDQASGRAHRIGQQRPVTVYRLVHAGTLEERIVELHQHKRALAQDVLDGTDAAAGVLQAEELLALIRD